MEVTVNEKQETLASATTVKTLVGAYGYDAYGDGIAVAINDNIIPKHQWETTIIKEHDNVTVIQATQGG